MNLKEVIIASIFFISITLIFFYKIFLGLIPLPADLIAGAYYPWLSYKWGYSVGVPVGNPKLSDAVSIIYPIRTLAVDLIKRGELPLWNPHMFAGYPLFASPLSGLLFPTMIFYLFLSAPLAWTLQTMAQPFFASIFMYLLLRHFGLKKFPGIFGSIVYGFGGSTILWIEWNSQANASLFLPVLVLLEDKFLLSKKLKWGVLLSIFLCFQIFSGYPPMIPFTLIALTGWYMFRVKNFKANLAIIFFILLGFSLSAVFSLPVLEHIQISQRKVETLEETMAFFSQENFITLISPDFFGNPASGNFWGKGDNMDFTIYSGIATLIFSFFGIRNFFRKKEVKFALCLIIIAIVISVANPLSILLYKLGIWGGYSLTMNRTNFMINFSLSILSAYGISLIRNNFSKLSIKPSFWVLTTISAIAFILFIKKAFLLRDLDPTLDSISHINISLKNLILPFLLTLIVFLLTLFVKNKKIKRVAEISFILILIFDLFRFGLKFNVFSSPNLIYPETPISGYLEKYSNDRMIAERVIFPANMWIPFKLSSIIGYDGVYPLIIAQLLATANSGRIDTPPLPRWGIIENFDSKIIDETNTRFVVALKRDAKGNVTESGEIDKKLKLPKYRQVFEDQGVAILENTSSLPRIYLTKKAVKASDQETLKLMQDENFPIRETSITDDFEFNNDSTDSLDAHLSHSYLTNTHLVIKTVSNMDAFLVVLDSFYPGWKVIVDGKQALIHRTNYNFRGIVLPEGNHTVEFIYAPNSIKYGAIISLISLLIIISLFVFKKVKEG